MKNRGITLFISVVIMGILLLVSFVVVDIAIKNTFFASTGKDSQLAFFAADSGIECALYWDSKADAFNTGASASWAEVHIMEFSGIDRSAPLDKASMRSEGSNNNPLNITSGSKTTTYSDEMIIGYTDQWYYNGDEDTVKPGPGFTKIAGDFSDGVEYKNVTSMGTYDASFSMENPGNGEGVWGALMATFKAAPGETPAYTGNHKAGDRSNPGQSITFNNPSSSGNFIAVAFQYNTGDFFIDSIKDNKNNNYYKAIGPLTYLDNGEPRSQELWYAYDITGGGVPISITPVSQALVPVNISCNDQTFNAGLGPEGSVKTVPTQRYRIGGNAAASNPEPGSPNTSIFQLDFPNGSCAIVRVHKDIGQPTVIKSRGYNTCNPSNPRRVERGLEVRY